MESEVIMDNTKKQNILIVHNYYQIPGGEDTVVANEKKMLEKNGHKVFLYNRNNGELKQMSKIKFFCQLQLYLIQEHIKKSKD